MFSVNYNFIYFMEISLKWLNHFNPQNCFENLCTLTMFKKILFVIFEHPVYVKGLQCKLPCENVLFFHENSPISTNHIF